MKFFAAFVCLVAVASAFPTSSQWSLNELSDAIQDPQTNPALLPILEQALNELMSAIWAGQQVSAVPVVIPAGLLPVEPSPVPLPVPIAPPTVVPGEVVPAASGPLVAIIVNVNAQQLAPAPAPTPSPVVVPRPEPGHPVIVVEQPEIPDIPDIIAISPPENPIDIIAVSPPEHPIDIIAISPPEVNPIDILAPLPVQPGGAGSDIVGPIM